jgi:hypothetical protein
MTTTIEFASSHDRMSTRCLRHSRSNTGDKLRSSNMLGFVCFIPLFDRVVALEAVVQPAVAKSTQDTKKHTLASEIPMIGVLNQYRTPRTT